MEECFSTSSILIPFTSFASVSFADIFRARVLACACPRAALDGARRRSTSTPVRSTQRRRRASRAPQIFKTKSAGEFSRITSARIVLSAPPKEKNAHATLFKCFGLRDTVRPRAHLPGTGAEGTAVRGRAFALGARAAMADPITGAPPPPSPPPTLSFGCGDDDQCVYFDVSDREILVSLLIFATMGGLLLLVFGCIRHKAPIFFGRRRLRNLVRVPPASKPAWVPVVRASHGSRRSFSLAPGVRVLRHRVRRSYPFSALLLSPPPPLPPPPHKNPPPAPRRTAPRPSLGQTARGATPFSVG